MATSRSGFSLVELLLAMAVLGVLAGLTITAINPGKQLADARNTQRKFDVNTILNAFGQYSTENGGLWQPMSIGGVSLLPTCSPTETPKKLCRGTTPHGTDPGYCGDPAIQCVYSNHLVGPFIADVPDDPYDTEGTVEEQATVDYLVSSQSPGRFKVEAIRTELGQTIGAMR